MIVAELAKIPLDTARGNHAFCSLERFEKADTSQEVFSR